MSGTHAADTLLSVAKESPAAMTAAACLQARAAPDNQRQGEGEHHAQGGPANLHDEGLTLHAERAWRDA